MSVWLAQLQAAGVHLAGRLPTVLPIYRPDGRDEPIADVASGAVKLVPRVMPVIAILALGACQSAYMLELGVSNDSAGDARLEIVEGVEPTPGAFVHLTEVIEPGVQRDMVMERPGPRGWTIVVNGEALTDSDEWPSDNPTIDLSIRIGPDGSVEVADK